MADYTIRVEADTKESQKKVDDLDKRLNEVERPRKIDIHIPSLQEAKEGINDVGKSLNNVLKIAAMIPGSPINDFIDVGKALSTTFQQVAAHSIAAINLLSKATPSNILSGAFTAASQGAITLSENVAKLGIGIFGVTQSVNILKSAFGGFFDETIGREIKLQETLLRTKTTLVSTADVAVNGKRITDPYEAILKLEKPIEKTVNNIRMRSLDIAGTTSDAIIQTFGVVASQIGQIGGSIKDAEDLAISFAGALGTMGLSDPMYATQEIGSIMRGTIDQNSVLARSLGLTNEDVEKAKKSADGLVVYLQKKLAAFTAGQSLAAKGFDGIVSNIQEVQQEVSRVFGKPFLQPMLDGLTKVYERLQLITSSLKKTKDGNPLPGPAMGIADALGRTGNAVLSGIAGAALQAPSLTKNRDRDQYQGAVNVEKIMSEVFLKVQNAIDKMRPQITLITDEVIKAITQISKGLVTLAAGFAQFKFESLKYMLTSWISLAQVLNSTVIPAITTILKLYGALFSNSVFQSLSQFTLQWQTLERVGLLPAIRNITALAGSFKSVITVLVAVPGLLRTLGAGIRALVENISQGFANSANFVLKTATAIMQALQLVIGGLTRFAAVISGIIGEGLAALAGMIQRLHPQFIELITLLTRVSRAFQGVAANTEVAEAGVASFAVRSVAYLKEVEVSTEALRVRLNSLGTGLTDKLKGAGGAVMGMLGGMLKFLAIQVAIQAAVTLAMTAYTKFKEKQQEISDQTRVEVALRRLSTVYKDLGDNATLAAKRGKEFEESFLSGQLNKYTEEIDKLNTKITELRNRPRELAQDNIFQSLGRAFTEIRSSKDIRAAMSPSELKRFKEAGIQPSQSILVLRVDEKKAQQELQRLKTSAAKILEYQSQVAAVQKAKEEVDILGKERNQLEKEIADYRKQLNKEITDNEFNFRQERLQIEQNATEARRASVAADMDRALKAQLAGLSGYRQQVAEILGSYKKNLFDAQTESQKRQFDLARQRERFEKNLADYKLKLEEQSVKLRQKADDYSAKVTKWQSQERIKTALYEIELARKAGTALVGRFTLMPDDRSDFLGETSGRDLSSQRTLALLKSLNDKDIQLLGGAEASLKTILDNMKERAPTLYSVLNKNVPQADFLNKLNTFLPPNTANNLYTEAGNELNNQQFIKYNPKLPPKPEGIDSILQMNNKALESYDKNQDAILANTKALYDLQDRLKAMQIEKDAVAALNAFIKEGMRTPEIIKEDLEASRTQINILSESIASGKNYADPYIQKIQENDRKVWATMQMINKSFGSAGVDQDHLKKYYDQYLSYKDNRMEFIDQPTSPYATLLNRLATVLNAGLARYRNDRDNRPAETQVTAQQEIAKLLQANLNLATTFEESSTALIQKIQEALLPSDPIQRRQFEANKQIEAIRRTPEYAQVSGNAEYMAALKRYTELIQLSATKLGELDKAVEAFSAKLTLIKDTATTVTEGFKTSFKNLLNGQITGFQEMVNTLREKFTTAFTDWIFKPIQDSIEKELRKWFNADNEAQKLAYLQEQYTKEFRTAVTEFGAAVKQFSGQPATPAPGTTPPGAPPSPEPAPAPGSASAPAPGAAPTAANNIVPSPSTVGSATTASAHFNALSTSISNLSETAKKAPSGIQQTTSHLQEFLGGMATVAAGITGIVAGFQQLGKKGGGAAGTLMGLSNIFIGLGTTLIGGGKLFRAAGGPVSANSPYIVGEKGPEWFVPSRSGTVLPNGTSPGGGHNVNSVVNVHINDSGARTDNNQASQLGRMIDSAVVNIINRERRPGGLLTTR